MAVAILWALGAVLAAGKVDMPLSGVGLSPSMLKSAKDKLFDLEPKAMFTHEDKELHCMDRELVHPCTTELKMYLKEKQLDFKDEAYQCAQFVYQTNTDFQVIKNMTHLLLDLDTSVHFFDKNLKEEHEFFELGLKFGRKLMDHTECMSEFDTKDELECRCPSLYAKIILLKLKNMGLWDKAQEMFDELKRFEWNGVTKHYPPGRAFPWNNLMQTPQMWFPNLASKPVWDTMYRDEFPIWKALEESYPDIRAETEAAFANNTAQVDDAYRFLFKEGNWDQILLYHGRNYTEACDKAFPKTCKMLKEVLPKRPQHHYPWASNQNEQALILRLKVGSDVETHCGPSNSIINVHLGIKGTKGAELMVNNKTYGWEAGKVIAWDGSFDHYVHCKECVEDRIVLMVRYQHPWLTPDHYKGSRRTHFEDIPQAWLDNWESEVVGNGEIVA